MVGRGILIFLLSGVSLATITAQERIAILSYGSLVKRSNHSVTGAHLRASPFEPTTISFPISLSPLAHKDRITAVIDTQYGGPKRVWVATSGFSSLHDAMQNLAAREGAPYLKNKKQYDTRYLFYVKQLAPGQKNQKGEQLLPAFEGWVIHDTADRRQQLDTTIINEIISFAKKNSFDAVVWVSCPIVPISSRDFIARLVKDPVMLKNAQMYVKLFADGPQTDLERAILQGKQNLLDLMHAEK